MSAGMLVACGFPAERTFEPGVEHISAGSVHFVADPPVARSPIEIRFRAEDGSSSSRAFLFDVGARIEETPTTVPGRFGFIVDGLRCDGDYPVEAARTTDVTIHLGAEGCALEVTGIHPETTVPPSEGA
jgi:hypothetical protein